MKRFLLILFLLTCMVGAVSANAFSAWSYADGCWTATNDTYTLKKWNATGAYTFDTGSIGTVEYLVIAGGAGGSRTYAGGGGAGGLLTGTGYSITGSVNVVVGDGGLPSDTTFGNGFNSSFANTTVGNGINAKGGGGGGHYDAKDAQIGGSGGGGAGNADYASVTGAAGTASQGNAGGNGSDADKAAGGGGGAGAIGGNGGAAAAGNGGNGLQSNITGILTYYAGGGGGGSNIVTAGTGGLGGGGNGATQAGTATAGTDGLGGGGGGGSAGGFQKGGSGVVIIKYLTPISPSLSANFTANVTTGYPNDYFQFTDTSTGTPITWDYGFGDGTANSTLQNPVHQYTAAGSYNLFLNASNSTSSSYITKQNYIVVSPLPIPQSPTFTANKTYSTSGSLPVLFTISSAAPPHLNRYNLSTGDGTWYNYSASSYSTITHTYASNGTFSPTLYVSNEMGTASTTTTDMIAVSMPYISITPSPKSINWGIPANVSVNAGNVSHAGNVLLNVTFNKSALQALDVYPTTGWTSIAGISNSNGFVTINLSQSDYSGIVSTALANIKFNVTSTGGNATEPLNIVASKGIIPASAYTSGLYGYNAETTGSISPTNTTFTQTFLFVRTDNGESLSTVQITNVWDGVTSGTAYTTTGSQTIVSTWGHINLTSTANAFYASNLYGIVIDGTTTTVLMTPYVPEQIISNVETPNHVQFHVQSFWGTPISGATVSILGITTTTGQWDWVAQIMGLDLNEVAINGTAMASTTDTLGNLEFMMLPSAKYMVNVSAAGYTFPDTIIAPHDKQYTIVANPDSNWFASGNNTLQTVNITVSTAVINNTHGFINITYDDTSLSTLGGKINLSKETIHSPAQYEYLGYFPIESNEFSNSTVVEIDQTGNAFKVDVDATSSLTPIERSFVAYFKGQPVEFAGFDSTILLWFSLFCVIFTAMFAGAAQAPQVSIVICIEGWIFWSIGWLNPLANSFQSGDIAVMGMLTMATFAAVIWNFREGKRKEKGS